MIYKASVNNINFWFKSAWLNKKEYKDLKVLLQNGCDSILLKRKLINLIKLYYIRQYRKRNFKNKKLKALQKELKQKILSITENTLEKEMCEIMIQNDIFYTLNYNDTVISIIMDIYKCVDLQEKVEMLSKKQVTKKEGIYCY